MRILLTGGAGYIGSELVGFLLAAGHEVRVVDSLLYGPNSLLRYVGHEKFDFEHLDVRQTTALKSHLAWADVIAPAAALVGYPLCEKKSVEATEVNLEVNRFIAKNKVVGQHLIYFCTNSGYGASNGTTPCTEESPMNPVSVYGITKVEAEKVYQQTPGCTTLRLATVFGPSTRMRTDLMVNNFVWNALRDRYLVLYECTYMRNYVHIWDICRAFLHVIDHRDACGDKTFNVGNDSLNCNKLDLALKVKEHLPVTEIIKAEINSDPDVRNYIVSSQKFYGTGFECKYNLDDGIKQLLKAYKMINQPHYGNY